MSTVTADGWYPDPTGRHVERLWLSGVWTRRVRDAEGVETTEGEDHSGAMTAATPPRAPRPVRGWSVERPSSSTTVFRSASTTIRSAPAAP